MMLQRLYSSMYLTLPLFLTAALPVVLALMLSFGNW